MMKLQLKGFIDGLDVECQIKTGSEYILNVSYWKQGLVICKNGKDHRKYLYVEVEEVLNILCSDTLKKLASLVAQMVNNMPAMQTWV